MNVVGLLLAGGQSRRMGGGDKALRMLAGQTLLDRVIERECTGMSSQQFSDLAHPSFSGAPQFQFFDKGGFDSAPFFMVGLGYRWNSWLRFDFTGEYRGKAGFHALDRFFNTGMGQLMQNKLKLTKGHMPTIVKYVTSQRELVETTSLVATKFRDEV